VGIVNIGAPSSRDQRDSRRLGGFARHFRTSPFIPIENAYGMIAILCCRLLPTWATPCIARNNALSFAPDAGSTIAEKFAMAGAKPH
jgi:hypothetical protein